MISNKNRALADHQSYDYQDQDNVVAEYLLQSPDFFSRNPDLLTRIEVPHRERGAVSLVERKLTMHREQCNDLRERLDEIVDVAHQNDHLAELLHEYSIGLISAASLAEVFEFTEKTLTSKLGCEDVRAVVLRNNIVETCMEQAPGFVSLQDVRFARSVRDLHTRRPVYCGHASPERIRLFFANTDLTVLSVAIIQLSQKTGTQTVEMGYLALASESKSRFAPHMGTEFLARFGSLLSARIAVFYD
ncbi:hypothetical protein AB833_16460 [Chromatiales bacterium (ex Bugula neritina AB1)]|nr:hypothetical protein AB833_16460 [Chromatiales bacterium (ex Bugula neritina AB1)]